MKQRVTREACSAQLLIATMPGGGDTLTLGKLWLFAKISKPRVSDHFGTREDLLIELCDSFDECLSLRPATVLH